MLGQPGMKIEIGDDCTNCAACEEECPAEAIRRGDGVYVVNIEVCTFCRGEYEAPRCIEICPVDDCVRAAA
jgi:ferredoxin